MRANNPSGIIRQQLAAAETLAGGPRVRAVVAAARVRAVVSAARVRAVVAAARVRAVVAAARVRAVVAGAVLATLLLGAGCTTSNQIYCDEDNPCAPGSRCAPDARVCVGIDAAVSDALSADLRSPGDAISHDGAAADGRTDDAAADQGALRENGAACTQPGQCSSGFCADGVCCDSACSGTCRSCALPGSAGSCRLTPAGVDPDQDCAGSDSACQGACDGEGACAFPDATEPCKPASCAAGQLTSYHCDGAGGCAPATRTCGGYACAATGDACKTSCTDASLDCMPGFSCIGNECANPQPNGSSCGTNHAACESGHCTDGVCCTAAACPVCHRCDLSGAGTCSPVPDPLVCGAVSCTAAEKTTPTCQAGACVPVKHGCAPYACNSAGDDCRTSCDSHGHCVAGFFCNASKQCETKRAPGQGCAADHECHSDHCTEGVCCNLADCGTCRSCTVAGSVGTCANLPDGAYPDHCPGDASCGARCEQGACAYEELGFACAATTCSASTGAITSYACDASHLCAATVTSCSPYRCEGSPPACLGSCTGLGECVSGSVCDFMYPSFETPKAQGFCVDPGLVTYVTASQDVNPLVAAGKYVLLTSGPHDTITVDQPGDFHVFSTGPVAGKVRATVTGKPAIHVKHADATLWLQRLFLTESHDGVLCEAGIVVILDSSIGNNTGAGVQASGCEVYVHRTSVINNHMGGVVLQGCGGDMGFMLHNSLVARNGSYDIIPRGSGGVYVEGCIGVVRGSTISDNVATTLLNASGLVADATHGLYVLNSIVWDNHQGPYFGKCSFSYSTVDSNPAPAGNGNSSTDCNLDSATFKPAANSVCIDSGNNANVNGPYDVVGAARIQGGTVDRGAYEIQ